VAERVRREVEVPAAHGGAIDVRAGEYLSIVALEGAQVADLSPINGGRIIPLGLVVGASADG